MKRRIVVNVVTRACFALVFISTIGRRAVKVSGGRQAREIQRGGGGEAVKEGEVIHGSEDGAVMRSNRRRSGYLLANRTSLPLGRMAVVRRQGQVNC